MKTEHTVGENNLYAERNTPQERSFENPLVFVHGSFGGYWMWNTVIPPLVGQGFECVSFSLRGHKPSGGTLEGTGMQDYADDVKTVVEELGLTNPVLVGHSMSGLVVLMYGAAHPVRSVVSIGPSPSLEVKGAGDEAAIAEIPPTYTAMDAGMPTDHMEAVKALPDVPREMLMSMKDMLGPESGAARKDRKRGISVPKESVKAPLLIMGSGLGDSVGFGISEASSRKMAEYYGAEYFEVAEATHPGIIMGTHAGEVAAKIAEWVKNR